MTTFRRSRRLTRLLASCVAVASLLSGSVSYASSQTPPAAPVLGPSLAEASMGPSPTPGPLGIPQTTPLQSFDERAKAGQSRCLGLPCTRPGMARLLAGVSGLLAMAGGTAMLMWIPRWSEPGGHIAGAGPVAVSGAIIGAVIGILSSERRAVDDRVQTATLGASYQRPAQAPLGEFHPGSLNVQASPVLRFSGQSSYLRPILILGSQLGRRTMLDPRPQAEHEIIGRLQTWQLAAGIEYGMWLPYPSRRKRHGYLGPVELLFRSFLETRREKLLPLEGNTRIVDRTMWVPLGAGIRWHLSARQRLTTLVGPRLDFIAFNRDKRAIEERSYPQLGRIYGETWYEIDVPLTGHERQVDANVRRWNGAGQLRMGYRQSMFDGRGLNAGAVVGFTGPMYLGWAMRWRSPGSPWAMQAGAGVWIANDWSAHIDFGIIAPDIRPSRYRALYRRQVRQDRRQQRRQENSP